MIVIGKTASLAPVAGIFAAPDWVEGTTATVAGEVAGGSSWGLSSLFGNFADESFDGGTITVLLVLDAVFCLARCMLPYTKVDKIISTAANSIIIVLRILSFRIDPP
jgi:hypothetical protein